MRNKLKKMLSLCLAAMMIATTVFAAETLDIDGYNKNFGQIRVSNITGKSEASMDGDGKVLVLNCDAPCKVETLVDLFVFSVTKLQDGYDKDGITYNDTYAGTPVKITGEVTGEDETQNVVKGAFVNLTEKGSYYIQGNYPAISGSASAIIVIGANSSNVPAPKKAVPTASKVLVNGTETSFDAYNIENNNYFKLRDLAKVVSGSAKQFEVTWDNDKKAINLVSGKAYTPVGGEMTKGDGAAKNAQINSSAIYLNGKSVSLKAYNINGNNYFKLRDLGQTFNFNVSWDGSNNSVVINTAESYTAD